MSAVSLFRDALGRRSQGPRLDARFWPIKPSHWRVLSSSINVIEDTGRHAETQTTRWFVTEAEESADAGTPPLSLADWGGGLGSELSRAELS